MGGGLMQLVAYGAQDIYLTGNPQITFFKVVYRRHTNFSMECIIQTINGTSASGGRTTATISRNGDLVHRMHVKSTRNATAAELNEGYGQFSNVILEIGGQQIDKHSGQWLETYTELTQNTTGRQFGTDYQVATGTCEGAISASAITALSGPNTSATTHFFGVSASRLPAADVIYTPLQFWFCRNPGLALPLIALQYHEVKVIFEWAASLSTGTNQELWVDYIYLDTDERRRFAQVSHEYLIEQVQEENGQAKATQDLHFNHPVKELIWTGAWTTTNGAMNCAAIDGDIRGNTVHLKLNGHDRMAAQPVTYFTRLMPLQYHTGSSIAGDSIAVYSFALKPEEHQPSGTCNFSRIDSAQLVCQDTTGIPATAKIFAVNYNVLRIMSGMGGLAYSN